MAKAKKSNNNFVTYLEEMGKERRLDQDTIIGAIKEAFVTAYTKKLEDEMKIPTTLVAPKVKKSAVKSKDGAVKDKEGTIKPKENKKLPNALIRFDIDLEKGKMDLFHQFKVTREDDIEDDFIEISDEDPRVIEKGLKVGEFYEEPIDITTFSKGDVLKFINVFNQKISQAEKTVLYETFKGKIGEIITGVVERNDNNRLLLVNLGNSREGAIAYLYAKDLIGHETYKPGDSIKVYVESIGEDKNKDPNNKDNSKKDNIIKISRACPEFLKKLFFNEVHEIYDGTVEIVDVARRAGVRSKVVVTSKDKNVDPSGACIGPNGSRIQAIVSQLGNAKDSKEKIDIITYNENKGVYLAECLKPGVVLGINFSDDMKSATVVCEDGTATLAIGLKGINVVLARQLLKIDDIKILDKSEADEKHITYKTMAEFEVESREQTRIKNREEALKKMEEVSPVVKENDVKENFLAKDEDEVEEIVESNDVNEEVVEPVVKEEPIQKREVNTTVSLNDLEASLEEKKEKHQESHFSKKKKEEKVVKEVKKEETEKKQVEKMSIYTDEELADMEEEMNEEEYEDTVNYDEYDDDAYYEDK